MKKTFSQKMAEAEELKAIESERAKLRKLANLKQGEAIPEVANLPQRDRGTTRDRVAHHMGVSGRTYATETRNAKNKNTIRTEPKLWHLFS